MLNKTMPFIKTVLICILCLNIASAQELPKLRINPEQAYGGGVSEYFSSVEFIPLETKKECLFGDINLLITGKNDYFIYDDDTKKIFIFSHSGKYKTYIYENWFKNRLSLSYLQDEDLIVVSGRKINGKGQRELMKEYFTSSGKKMDKSSLPPKVLSNKDLMPIGGGFSIDNKGCTIMNKQPKDSIFHLIDVYKNDVYYKSLMPYNQKDNLCLCRGDQLGYLWNNVVKDGSLYAATAFENIVYKITADSAVKQFQFQLPAPMMVPQNITKATKLSAIDSAWNNPKGWVSQSMIWHFSHIFYHQNKLFFKTEPLIYSSGSGSQTFQQRNFIYDTVSGRLVSIERLKPDALCNFLPFFNNVNLSLNGLQYDNKYFYTHVSSLDMFSAYATNKNRNPQYPPAIQNYFQTQNRKSNPVIVRMKLKD
jgi:hypothetical protein